MSSPSDTASFGRLTPELASSFARIALGHVTREYPNKMDTVLTGPADVKGPRAQHPIFFGSFDWHSCVHGYWTLATVLRRHPEIAEAAEIRALFNDSFTAAKVAAETAYALRPASRGFERPYGWAWLLKLQTELLLHKAPWAKALQPLADAFAQRFRDFLPLATYPTRTGVHSSTSFALTLAGDYAVATKDKALFDLLETKVRRWHRHDRDAQAWEPSQDDFLSPTLMTAVCLRRLLPQEEWRRWFEDYLPAAARQHPSTLFAPATVSDRTDGKIAHLDGLNLSRAWCWREIAAALPDANPARQTARRAADTHLSVALPHVAGDYMGEHWLASFALLALTAS